MPRPATQLVARCAPLAIRQLSPHVARASFLAPRRVQSQFHARGFRIWSTLSWDEDEYGKGFLRGSDAARGNKMRRKQEYESWSSSMTSGYKSGFRTARRLDREDAKTGRSEWVDQLIATTILSAITTLAMVALVDRYYNWSDYRYKLEELTRKAHARAESSNK
jgi:hypothetical protein